MYIGGEFGKFNFKQEQSYSIEYIQLKKISFTLRGRGSFRLFSFPYGKKLNSHTSLNLIIIIIVLRNIVNPEQRV